MEEIAALAVRARGGEVEAYGELVRRFKDMAYGYAYSVLGDFHLAEDVTQEAFIAAYGTLSHLREPAAFGAWLRRIVAKHCDRVTRRRRVRAVPLDAAIGEPSAMSDPSHVADAHERKTLVLEAVAALPDEERVATTLFYINGYSQAEVARFLEVPVDTVKNRLRASRSKLKERMLSMVDQTLKSHTLRDDFADAVVHAVSSEKDLRKAKEILASTYHARKHPEYFESVENAREAGVYLVGRKGRVESAGYYDEEQFSIGGHVLTAIRPREMAAEAAGVPDPAFVRGYLGAFKMAKSRKRSIAVVHGSMYDHAFVGFVPCFYYPVASLPRETALSITTRAKIRKAAADEAQAARSAWLTDPYAVRMTAFVPWYGTPHVVVEGGKVTGYVGVNEGFDLPRNHGITFGHVGHVIVSTREGALAVIRLAAELTGKAGADKIVFMQSHKTLIAQTIISLKGTYTLRGSCDIAGLDAEMVVILDFARLTKELDEAFRSRLAASPARSTNAALSIGMGGQIAGFVVRKGQLKIVEEKQSMHLELPRWLVTRLYMGYYSGEDVLSMGPIPYDRSDGHKADRKDLDMQTLSLPEEEAAVFRTLFPKLWPVSWPDPDVWPWVIGEPGPQYQNEEGKSRQMKAQIDALRFPWLGL